MPAKMPAKIQLANSIGFAQCQRIPSGESWSAWDRFPNNFLKATLVINTEISTVDISRHAQEGRRITHVRHWSVEDNTQV